MGIFSFLLLRFLFGICFWILEFKESVVIVFLWGEFLKEVFCDNDLFLLEVNIVMCDIF